MADVTTWKRLASHPAWSERHAPKSLWHPQGAASTATVGGPQERPLRNGIRWFDSRSEKRLTAPTWPTEFGGGGLSRDDGRVLD